MSFYCDTRRSYILVPSWHVVLTARLFYLARQFKLLLLKQVDNLEFSIPRQSGIQLLVFSRLHFNMMFFASLGPDDAPIIFDQSPAELTKIFLKWSKPKQPNGVLTDYKVCWSYMGKTPDCEKETSIVESYTITKLSPGIEYNVMVSASTKVGYGPNSSTKVISTDKSGKSYLD